MDTILTLLHHQGTRNRHECTWIALRCGLRRSTVTSIEVLNEPSQHGGFHYYFLTPTSCKRGSGYMALNAD
ncbi:hypothetical protein COCON_G00148860 [Conger conger]|uniref:Uncharacterized protein n=1 Tax=Conger conger TaxID=82655 RepID=A0A9Q1HUN1_CONCO|nr:hypothetical protein COCON_G00148860 [Conger conger]